MQGFPHLLGPGLLHDLVLLFWPPPQVLLHELQPDQAENAPSTAGSTDFHVSILERVNMMTYG